MKKLILFFLFCIVMQNTQAAPAFAYRVSFKDKNGTAFTFADSLQFLSPTAMARRSKQGIALDSSDLPLVQHYIDTVMQTANAVKLHNKSKWFNQIVVITFDSTVVSDLLALPMVNNVTLVARYANGIFKQEEISEISKRKFPDVVDYDTKKTRANPVMYGQAYQQANMIGADCLHDLGYRGEGMKIAVIDVNFRRTDSCTAFNYLLSQNRVIDVYNFVKDTPYVYSMAIPSDHGMNVMGCIGAKKDSMYWGTAYNADFYLYISEDIATEYPIEEDNWLSAAERADSIGVDMINSSLGYNIFDAPFAAVSYTYANMDGKTSLIAKAANKAVSKGIFVVNAQGNEGLSPWHYMLTPADADSVLSVGSVDGSGIWGGSGYGPNALGVMKPDVCALGKGTALIGGNCKVGISNGSSFASPIMCGGIACLWQAFPTMRVWELRQIVRMVGDKYNNPNFTLGYGVPNLCQAYQLILNTSDIKHIDYRFTIYPNPTSHSITIKNYDDHIKQFSYAIYNIEGKCLFQSDEIKESVTTSDILKDMPIGNYIITIKANNQLHSTQVSKK